MTQRQTCAKFLWLTDINYVTISWTVTNKTYGDTMTVSNVTWGHYGDVIMGAIASQITSLTSVYSTVYSGADQRQHQSSASLAFVRGIHRRPMNSPHKWPVTRKMFPFDDVIKRWEFAYVRVRLRFSACHSGCWDMYSYIFLLHYSNVYHLSIILLIQMYDYLFCDDTM